MGGGGGVMYRKTVVVVLFVEALWHSTVRQTFYVYVIPGYIYFEVYIFGLFFTHSTFCSC